MAILKPVGNTTQTNDPTLLSYESQVKAEVEQVYKMSLPEKAIALLCGQGQDHRNEDSS